MAEIYHLKDRTNKSAIFVSCLLIHGFCIKEGRGIFGFSISLKLLIQH